MIERASTWAYEHPSFTAWATAVLCAMTLSSVH